jgi:hypothetical protein
MTHQNKNLPSAEVHVDNLVEFIFIRNVNDAVIEMSFDSDEISTSKDLFYFCLDLFCKGLVVLYGNGSNAVELEKLSIENFQFMHKKLLNAGIEVILNVIPKEPTEEEQIARINLTELNSQPDNLNLEQYKLCIDSVPISYEIRFKLVRTLT